MKLATIKIPLTLFEVDIVVGGSKDEYSKLLQKRYGLSEVESDESDPNECSTIASSANSDLGGRIQFVLKLDKMPNKNMPVFVHELWHLMWHISNTIGDIKLNKDTQSWGACMIEELFNLITNAKYKNIEK